jgi:hypothetical protein
MKFRYECARANTREGRQAGSAIALNSVIGLLLCLAADSDSAARDVTGPHIVVVSAYVTVMQNSEETVSVDCY